MSRSMRARRRRRRIALTLLLGLVLAGFGLRPGWRLVKKFRASLFAREAVALEAREEWMNALSRARAALQLDPDNSRALRVSAAILARNADDQALQFYQSLLATPDATLSDREDCVAFALALRQLDFAAVHLDILNARKPPSPRTLALDALHNLIRGDLPAAVPLAREAVEREPANSTNRFTLATVLATSRARKDIDEARDLLWPIATTDGPFQLDALGILFASRDLPRADREKAAAILLDLPNPTFDARLLTYTARLSLDPSQGRMLARELITRLRPADDRQLTSLVRWLIARGFADEALPLLAGDRVLGNRNLFLSRYDALVASGDLAKAYQLLFSPKAPLDACELEQLRCRTADLRQDPSQRDTHLANALKLAGTDPRRVAAVTRLAEACGQPAAAVAAWQALLSRPTLAPIALRQLMRLASAEGDTRGARGYLQRLSRIEPNDPGLRLALAHADLLLDENVEAATAEATRQLHERPNDPQARAVTALGRLRQGDSAAAALAIQGTVLQAEKTAPGLIAIVAAVLDAAGEVDKAREVLFRVRLPDLRPEERELLRPLLLRDTPLATPPPNN